MPNKKLHLKSSRECILRRVTQSLFRVEQHCKFMSACSFHWYSDNACQMQLSLHLQNLLSRLLVSTGSAKFNSCFKMGIKLGCSCFSHQNTRAQSWGRVHGFITPLSDTAAICSLKKKKTQNKKTTTVSLLQETCDILLFLSLLANSYPMS